MATVTEDHDASGHGIPPATTKPEQRRDVRPATLLLVAGLLPATVVYGLHWRRGYYLDDPRYDAMSAQELVEEVGRQRARPLGNTLTGVTYLIGEPAGRLLSAIILGAVAALAAALVRRTCGGRIGPVVAALLVVYPVLDFESALFWYAAILYPAGAAFGLAAGHCFLSTLRAPDRRSAVTMGVACAALFAGGLACTETAINFLLLVPGLSLVERLGRRVPHDRRASTRLLATGGAAVASVGALGAFLYLPQSALTSGRGNFIVNPFEGAGRVITVWVPYLQDLAFSRTRLRIHGEAFRLGLANLREPLVLAVFVAAVALGAFAVVASRRGSTRRIAQERRIAQVRRCSAVLGATGAALFAVASFVPGAFLSAQVPVTRLLFPSWVGLALVVGAVAAAIEASPRTGLLRLVAAGTMAAVLVLAVTLDGYGELYRRRDVRSDEQLAAWIALLDAVEPLPGDARGVNFYGQDQLLDGASVVDNTFVGITELPWVTSRMIEELRGNPVGIPGGHPSVPVCIERTDDPSALHVTTFFIDEVTPIASLLPVEMYDDRFVVIDEIRFGSTVVRFPLAERAPAERYERVQLETSGDRLCRAYGRAVG